MAGVLCRREFLKMAAISAAGMGFGVKGDASAIKKSPNVVIIFLDDSGWGDFKPFGKPKYPTPNVARLAKDGCRFDNFYVPQAVCSASRTALLTGCFPGRTRVFGAHGPNAKGCDPKFATLGQVLKKRGYSTGAFGKWHIGDQPATRPPARGFDESCGLMYSNDMWEFHPENPEHWGKFPLRYWENGEVTIDRVTTEHQPNLTKWYTEKAVDFIDRKSDGPFFAYVPHSMPHVPLFCSEKFKGKSGQGLYGDVMMEIDWSVGQIVKALKRNGVEDNTLVLMTSDNGPWISYGDHAGVTPFREAKGTTFDGGTRSACIVKYPGKIKADSVSKRAWCSIDVLPTVVNLTGAVLPANEIDGKNVWDLIRGKAGATNPQEYYAFTNGGNFEGVLSGDGRWKLHLEHRYRTMDGQQGGKGGLPGKYKQMKVGLSLFDMENDKYETTNVIEKYPEVAEKLKLIADKHKKKFFTKK